MHIVREGVQVKHRWKHSIKKLLVSSWMSVGRVGGSCVEAMWNSTDT